MYSHLLFYTEMLPDNARIRIAIVSVDKDQRKSAVKMCPTHQQEWNSGKHTHHNRGVNREGEMIRSSSMHIQ